LLFFSALKRKVAVIGEHCADCEPLSGSLAGGFPDIQRALLADATPQITELIPFKVSMCFSVPQPR
jgi:hypothetical protein